MPVTKTPAFCQWAETQRMAAGRGSAAAAPAQARLNSLSSMAFIGLPCPTKTTGMRPTLKLALPSTNTKGGLPARPLVRRPAERSRPA